MASKKQDKGSKGQAVASATEQNKVEASPTPANEGGSPAGGETKQVAVKKEKVMPTLEQALATAKEKKPGLYGNVVRVTELTKDGEPKRVVITCQDPQTKREGDKDVSVCVKEREIAVQDLFQVTRCVPCADRVVRKARRTRQKQRMKSLKQMDAARKGR